MNNWLVPLVFLCIRYAWQKFLLGVLKVITKTMSKMIELEIDSILNRKVTLFRNFVMRIGDYKLGDVVNTLGTRNKSLIQKIRAAEPRERGQLKKQLPAYTPAGTFKSGRCKGSLFKANMLMGFDVDLETPGDALKALQKVKEQPCVCLAMLSVSGNGVFFMCPYGVSEAYYERLYKKAEIAFASEGIEVDPSCCDYTRLRFVSYDPAVYVNNDAIMLEEYVVDRVAEDAPRVISRYVAVPPSQFTGSLLQRATNIIANSGVDLTTNYSDWIKIASVYSGALGEAGRDYFHAVSRFYQGYTKQECDKLYDYCLLHNYQVAPSFLFFLMKQHNLYLKRQR